MSDGAADRPAARADALGRVCLTLGVGAAGALAAWLLAVPAPFLTGPALSVTALALGGRAADVPAPLRNGCFVVIGAGLGAGVTPETLRAASAWPLSLAALAAALAVTLAGGVALMRRGFGYDRPTALLASSPGHLSYVLSLSAGIGSGDVPTLALVQSLRLLALTLLVPLAVALSTGGEMTSAPVAAGPAMAPLPLGLVLAAAAGLGLLFVRWRAPAGFLLGGMAAAAAAQTAGLAEGGLPGWLAVPAFVAMGTLIGTRFAGVTPALLRRALGAAVVVTGYSCAIAGAAALAVSAGLDLPLTQVLIAFAPGGLETMAALAVLLDADPAYVAAHHTLRMLLLTGMIPAMLALR